jgi:tetratricopeptide (TPR) repeat protein
MDIEECFQLQASRERLQAFDQQVQALVNKAHEATSSAQKAAVHFQEGNVRRYARDTISAIDAYEKSAQQTWEASGEIPLQAYYRIVWSYMDLKDIAKAKATFDTRVLPWETAYGHYSAIIQTYQQLAQAAKQHGFMSHAADFQRQAVKAFQTEDSIEQWVLVPKSTRIYGPKKLSIMTTWKRTFDIRVAYYGFSTSFCFIL